MDGGSWPGRDKGGDQSLCTAGEGGVWWAVEGGQEVRAQVQVGKEVWWEPEEYLIIFNK